ncbi:MAG: diguanylate cyclase [Spirochaetes bacterium]|nr:diguanylate cyclase [Spirochaetota bacterium]
MQLIESYLINLLPYGIVTLITCIIVFLISINLVVKGFRTRLVRATFLFCLSLIVWMFCGGLLIITPSYVFAAQVSRFFFLGWVFIPLTFYYIAHAFANRKSWDMYVFLALALVFGAASLLGPVHTVNYNYFGFYPKLVYPWNIIINTYYFTTVCMGLVVLFGEYLTAATNSRRNQARLLWLGTSAGFMIAVSETIYIVSGAPGIQDGLLTARHYLVNYAIHAGVLGLYAVIILSYRFAMNGRLALFLPLRKTRNILLIMTPVNVLISYAIYLAGCPLFPWSQVGIIIAFMFISYAILRYRLIDITEIFQRLLVYLALAIVFFGIWFVFIVGMSPSNTQMLFSILYALLVVALFNPLHMLIQRMVGHFVFPQRFDYQKTIMDVSMRVVTVLDYNRLIEIVRDTILNTVKASSFALLVYEDENDSYIPVSVHGVPPENITSLSTMDETIRFIRLVNREIFREELEDDRSGESTEITAVLRSLNAELIIPMTLRGSLKGILCIGDRMTGEIYNRRDIELLQILANHIVIALENARLYELAIRDGLTKLYISRFFHQRVSEEITNTVRARRQLSLLMIDLDHFKAVNDTYGHQVGDQVLKETSHIISDQVRLVDIVSRYGGEEFAVILPETDNERAASIAERIRKKMEGTTFPRGIRKTISIGIATIDGKATSAEIGFDSIMSRSAMHSKVESVKMELIRRADEALYAAKAGGRNLCNNAGIIHVKTR